MGDWLRRGLPIIAVIGALVALVCLSALSLQRRAPATDTDETRRNAEKTLARIEATRPASLDDTTFQATITQAKDAPYVAAVWLFTPDGQILEGSQGFVHSTVEASATDEARQALAALPEGTLNTEQRTALLAVSVMRAREQHDDTYRQLLREVRGPEDELVALVGVTYEVSPAIHAPAPAAALAMACGFLGLATYWISLPVWVWLDARDRAERAWAWAVFVLLGNLVGVITYILARRPTPPAGPTR